MNRFLARAAVVVLLVTAAAEAAPPSTADPVTAALSPETRALLIREMQALAGSMTRIHRALITGHHDTVRSEAGNIHDSFVLAQNLTADQRQEIQAELPKPFIALDRRFHALAARLADAAAEESPDVERFWFAEMTRTCQECHARFATSRFPGLVDNGKNDSHEQ